MGKCPYCNKELHIEDFFIVEKKKRITGIINIHTVEFKGESIIPPETGARMSKMWVCPSCDAILGFSER